MSPVAVNPLKLPREVKGHGYLYVVEFSTGLVKVGSTRNPYTRISAYRTRLAPFDIVTTACWVSRPHRAYLALERSLIAAAAGMATGSRQAEYFLGVDFAALVATVERRNPDLVPPSPTGTYSGPAAPLPCANLWRELNTVHFIGERLAALALVALARARAGWPPQVAARSAT